jgi:hypothetical protein
MQTITYVGLPDSFKADIPMSVQLREERRLLFENKYERVFVDVKDHKILLAACLYLNTSFEKLAYSAFTRKTGRNYDLYAIIQYLVTRKLYRLCYLQQNVFIERKIMNYKRQLLLLKDQQKYIDLFNYLDTLL